MPVCGCWIFLLTVFFFSWLLSQIELRERLVISQIKLWFIALWNSLFCLNDFRLWIGHFVISEINCQPDFISTVLLSVASLWLSLRKKEFWRTSECNFASTDTSSNNWMSKWQLPSLLFYAKGLKNLVFKKI